MCRGRRSMRERFSSHQGRKGHKELTKIVRPTFPRLEKFSHRDDWSARSHSVFFPETLHPCRKTARTSGTPAALRIAEVSDIPAITTPAAFNVRPDRMSRKHVGEHVPSDQFFCVNRQVPFKEIRNRREN